MKPACVPHAHFVKSRVSTVLACLLMAVLGTEPMQILKAQNIGPRSDAAAELAAIQDQWCKARISGDSQFLQQLYADDVTIGVSDGRVIGRAEDLAEFAAKKSRPESVVDEDLKIKVYGDIAVVTAAERMRGHAGGSSAEVVLRVLNVFRRTNGEWKLIARQGTSLNGPASSHP